MDSVHSFDSWIRFMDSIQWFDSLIRFLDSIYWLIHWFGSKAKRNTEMLQNENEDKNDPKPK